jgi:hypothetical protein
VPHKDNLEAQAHREMKIIGSRPASNADDQNWELSEESPGSNQLAVLQKGKSIHTAVASKAAEYSLFLCVLKVFLKIVKSYNYFPHYTAKNSAKMQPKENMSGG